MSFNWDDFRYLLSVAEKGTLSAAAGDLGVNPSTVLRRIDGLEHSIGTRLFDRRRSGYRLTHEGAELVQSLKPVTERLAAVERLATAGDGGGPIRIFAEESLLSAFVVPRLRALERGTATVVIEFVSGTRLTGDMPPDADGALLFTRPTEGDVVIRKLADIGFGLYAGPEYVARHGTPVRSGGRVDLSGHAVIGFEARALPTGPVWWLERMSGEATIVMRSDSAAVRTAATRSGQGIGVLPCFLASGEGGLFRLAGPGEVGSVELWLASRSDARQSRALRAFSDFAIKMTRDRRALLAGGEEIGEEP